MFSKSGIMAEELKQQLGDVLPTAMVALEKSTGKTSTELFKMMQMGQLGQEYIMPFLDAMADMAKKNGALESALLSTAKAQDKFMTGAEIAGNTIYTSGFAEGLGELFRNMTEELEGSEDALKSLGKVFRVFFKGVSNLINLITPAFRMLALVMGSVVDAFEWLFGKQMGDNILSTGVMVGMLILKFKLLTKAAKLFGYELKMALLPLTAIMVILDELYSFMDDSRTNRIEEVSGIQGWQSLNPFHPVNISNGEIAMKNAHLQYANNQPINVTVPVSIDGVKKSVDEQMSVVMGNSMVGNR